MTIIDFTAARAAKAAGLQAVREKTETVIADTKALAEHYAVLAFAASGPVRLVNERLAVDINRSQLRRVLATVRKATREAVPEVRADLRNFAAQAFAVKLDGLIRESDRQRGTPPAFEVVGGLWVATGRKPWVPSPWPTVTTLGRLGTLAWMTHIETTPYAMKPGTRAVFDAARKEMQAGATWPGTEAERVLNRIIRSCWERGWRPDERATA